MNGLDVWRPRNTLPRKSLRAGEKSGKRRGRQAGSCKYIVRVSRAGNSSPGRSPPPYDPISPQTDFCRRVVPRPGVRVAGGRWPDASVRPALRIPDRPHRPRRDRAAPVVDRRVFPPFRASDGLSGARRPRRRQPAGGARGPLGQRQGGVRGKRARRLRGPAARLAHGVRLEGPRVGPRRQSLRRGAQPARWSMGLLASGDWQAHWIGGQSVARPGGAASAVTIQQAAYEATRRCTGSQGCHRPAGRVRPRTPDPTWSR